MRTSTTTTTAGTTAASNVAAGAGVVGGNRVGTGSSGSDGGAVGGAGSLGGQRFVAPSVLEVNRVIAGVRRRLSAMKVRVTRGLHAWMCLWIGE